jgi:hypothetical protein
MAAIAQLKAVLKMDNAQYKAGMRDSKTSTKSLQQSISKVGAAIAGAFSIGIITRFARAATQLGSEISDLATQSGLTTDQLQALEVSAIRAGSSADRIRTIFSKISVTLGQAKSGMKTYVDLFEKLGISQRELSRLDTAGAFERISQVMATASQGSVEFGAGLELLGTRSGARVLEVMREINDVGLNGLVKSAQEAGQVIDADVIKKLDEIEDKLQLTGRRLKGVFGGLLVSLVSGIEDAAKYLAAKVVSIETGVSTRDVIAAERGVAANEDRRAEARKSAAADKAAKEQDARNKDKADAARFKNQSAEDDKRAQKTAKITQANRKRDAAAQKLVDRRQDIIDKAQERIKAERERDLNIKGIGQSTDALAQTGGFVGASRGDLGIADRKLKLEHEKIAIQKRIEKIEEKMAADIAKIENKMQPNGTP